MAKSESRILTQCAAKQAVDHVVAQVIARLNSQLAEYRNARSRYHGKKDVMAEIMHRNMRELCTEIGEEIKRELDKA